VSTCKIKKAQGGGAPFRPGASPARSDCVAEGRLFEVVRDGCRPRVDLLPVSEVAVWRFDPLHQGALHQRQALLTQGAREQAVLHEAQRCLELCDVRRIDPRLFAERS
jgi:hypothetical protein